MKRKPKYGEWLVVACLVLINYILLNWFSFLHFAQMGDIMGYGQETPCFQDHKPHASVSQ